ncbi:response regulator transcription factor [Spirosoma sp. BT702]|uniref:Response regulator transcription factor n=1 Tax=Spirosoma profusum TaxID=2771354 RepID=A0A927AWU6_9BACT|nr:LytTR family DNA-binding domain-containing protein [Spirosoma profusum]MBD2705826.1 response regulator transcription factor [Spirosoma profusum]
MTPIRCVVVDDEPMAVHLLTDYISQIPFLTLVYQCNQAIEALTYLQRHPADLLFVDINMPHLTGMELIQTIPSSVKVIFTTAYEEYAVESYTNNAVDYLLKPITFSRFTKAVTKVFNLYNPPRINNSEPVNVPESERIFIKSGTSLIQIEWNTIDYVEGLKDYVVIVMKGQRHIVHRRLKDLETSLPPFFQRIHHSYIVNLNNVEKVEHNQIHIGSARLSVSDKYRDMVMNRIQARLF